MTRAWMTAFVLAAAAVAAHAKTYDTPQASCRKIEYSFQSEFPDRQWQDVVAEGKACVEKQVLEWSKKNKDRRQCVTFSRPGAEKDATSHLARKKEKFLQAYRAKDLQRAARIANEGLDQAARLAMTRLDEYAANNKSCTSINEAAKELKDELK